MDDVERAQEVLAREREAVAAELARQRAIAARLADDQRRWRSDVEQLLARGRGAGMRVAAMADALGVSRQWTNHLAKRRFPSATFECRPPG